MENLKGLTDYDEVSESVITFEEDNNVNNANSLSVDADININENDNENKAESITTKEDEEDIIADNNKNLKDIFLSKLSHKKENKEILPDSFVLYHRKIFNKKDIINWNYRKYISSL